MPDIPLAVAPNVRTPQTALVVNLKSGAPSPASGTMRALIMGPPNTSGSTITPGTQLVSGVSGPAEIATLFGEGGPTHLLALALFAEYGIAQCDAIACAEPAGVAATGTLTFGSTPTVARVVRMKVKGVKVEVSWPAGMTATDIATLAISEYNKYSSINPAVASSGGAGIVTFTAKAKGLWGNDVLTNVELVGGAGGTASFGATTLTGGTLDNNYATALALVAGNEYDDFASVVSNTDAVSATGYGLVIKTHIELYVSGGAAKLQAAVVACTQATNASLKVMTAAVNYERLQALMARDAQSLPCEFVGARVGQRLREYSANPNTNVVGLAFKGGLVGPLNLATGTPTAAELEDDAQSGIAPVSYDGTGSAFLVAHFTTYYKTTSGSADDRVLFDTIQKSCDQIGKDIRTLLPALYPGMNIIDTLPEGVDLPDKCVTIAEIRASVTLRMGLWISRGVVDPAKWAILLANGEYIIRQNPTDGHQVDVVVPASIVKHLTKWSIAVLNRQ